MDGQRFAEIVPVALKEILDAEYPGQQHNSICRVHVLNESGVEIMNDLENRLRLLPHEINEETAKQEIKQRIYEHCVTARRAR
jgi:hypothetical protein